MTKKLIVKICAVILLLEGILLLYSLIPTYSYLHTYGPDTIISIDMGMVIILSLCIIFSGIGLFLKKNWSIVLSWMLLILPTLFPTMSTYHTSLPFLSHSLYLLVNTIIVIFLATQWKRLN